MFSTCIARRDACNRDNAGRPMRRTSCVRMVEWIARCIRTVECGRNPGGSSLAVRPRPTPPDEPLLTDQSRSPGKRAHTGRFDW